MKNPTAMTAYLNIMVKLTECIILVIKENTHTHTHTQQQHGAGNNTVIVTLNDTACFATRQ